MKGEVTIFSFFKRILIFLVVLMLSSSLFIMASSFSIAEIKSNVGINISDSEDSLIGIPSIIEGGTIQKEICTESASYLPVSRNIPVVINNNMNCTISITSIISNNNSDVLLQTDRLSNLIQIRPGGTGVMTFIATANPQTQTGVKTFNLTFNANWNCGNAIIKSQINFRVIEPTLIKNNSLFNTPAYTMKLQKNPVYVGILKAKEDEGSYNNDNSDISIQSWMDILQKQHTMVESHEILYIKDNEESIVQNEAERKIEKEKYEKNVAELYHRCKLVSADIGNKMEEINTGINSHYPGMKLQQSPRNKSMLVEMYQEYSRIYSELQTLIGIISGIAKSEINISDSDIFNIMQQIQSIEINIENLDQRYMMLNASSNF